MDGFKTLREGEDDEFEVETRDRGMHARNVIRL
jgi:cold shock CspA family protein